jgi:hypothetical protein
VLEVHERPVGPEPVPEVFATDHLAWAFEQSVQEGQRLVRQAVCAAFAPQLSRLGLELEWSEADQAWRG